MINDDVMPGRIPRLGTVTTGRGVEATSKRGQSYSQPTRGTTLVFHTNDGEVADALQRRLGGSIHTDSPTWGYDVETDSRTVDVQAYPAGFRQALELWRAGECLRRCDGVTMSRPAGQACACAAEIDQGQDRACAPSTILPVLVDLPVDRLGLWEVRSSSWGTAANVKGTIRALAMLGVSTEAVPCRLEMVDRTVRDPQGEARDVVEFALTITQSRASLAALTADELPAGDRDELPAGPSADRQAAADEWEQLVPRIAELGLRDLLAERWRNVYGSGVGFADLSDDQFRSWVNEVADVVAEQEQPAGDPEGVAAGDSGGQQPAEPALPEPAGPPEDDPPF